MIDHQREQKHHYYSCLLVVLVDVISCIVFHQHILLLHGWSAVMICLTSFYCQI